MRTSTLWSHNKHSVIVKEPRSPSSRYCMYVKLRYSHLKTCNYYFKHMFQDTIKTRDLQYVSHSMYDKWSEWVSEYQPIKMVISYISRCSSHIKSNHGLWLSTISWWFLPCCYCIANHPSLEGSSSSSNLILVKRFNWKCCYWIFITVFRVTYRRTRHDCTGSLEFTYWRQATIYNTLKVRRNLLSL